MSAPPRLSATTSVLGDAIVVRLEGDVDLASAPAVRAALDRARPDGGTFVLDLRGVGFMDSSGLHLLLDEQRAAARARHAFVVVGAHDQVLDLLRLTGVDALVRCAGDWRAAAVASGRDGAGREASAPAAR